VVYRVVYRVAERVVLVMHAGGAVGSAGADVLLPEHQHALQVAEEADLAREEGLPSEAAVSAVRTPSMPSSWP
jgi:hypothetical protein